MKSHRDEKIRGRRGWSRTAGRRPEGHGRSRGPSTHHRGGHCFKGEAICDRALRGCKEWPRGGASAEEKAPTIWRRIRLLVGHLTKIS